MIIKSELHRVLSKYFIKYNKLLVFIINNMVFDVDLVSLRTIILLFISHVFFVSFCLLIIHKWKINWENLIRYRKIVANQLERGKLAEFPEFLRDFTNDLYESSLFSIKNRFRNEDRFRFMEMKLKIYNATLTSKRVKIEISEDF